jgi:hypothetical protein
MTRYGLRVTGYCLLLMVASAQSALPQGSPVLYAGTCVASSSCPPPPIQFIPGRPISIEVVNSTYIPVVVQHLGMANPLTIASRQTISILRGTTVSPNFSLIFWTSEGGTLVADVSQPAEQVLRIEIRASRSSGNNAVYVRDDGRVEVF